MGREGKATEQSTRLRLEVFDVQRGRGIAAGTTTRSHEGRGMCVAKQAAGNETTEGQAAASVSDMKGSRARKWIARASLAWDAEVGAVLESQFRELMVVRARGQ